MRDCKLVLHFEGKYPVWESREGKILSMGYEGRHILTKFLRAARAGKS